MLCLRFLWKHRRSFAASAATAWLMATPGSGAQTATQTAPQTVRAADDFVDSIGMNGLGGPYVYHYGGERQKLYNTTPVAPQYLLGVRHTRYEFRPDSDLFPLIRLAQEQGIRINALVSWLWTDTPANKNARITDALPWLHRMPAGSIDAIEGNNEADMPFESGDYTRYASSMQAAQENQRELYRAVKADPQFKNIPIIAWTLGKNWPWGGNIGYGAFTSTDYDYESMHSYPAGDTISDSLLTPGHNQWLKVAHSIASPGAAAKPIIATETGFTRRMVGPNKKEYNSELAQAKTIPILLAENFRRGVKRTFIYAVGGEPAWSMDAHDDGTPLPAGRAVSFFTAMLGEARWKPAAQTWSVPKFKLDALMFSLSAAPASVHSLTLEKSDHTFYLLLWNDVIVWDGKNFKDIQNPPVPVTAEFKTPLAGATIFTMNADGSYISRAAALSGTAGHQTLKVEAPDSLLLIRLTAAPKFKIENPK